MSDRARKAFEDVVAIEKKAPGIFEVVTVTGAYTVDPNLEACRCPDFEYNLDGEGRCKHIWAALDADGQLGVGHHDPVDLGARPTPQVATDGGRNKWIVRDETGTEHPFDSRKEAEERARHARDELDMDCDVLPPTEPDGGDAVVVDVDDEPAPTQTGQYPDPLTEYRTRTDSDWMVSRIDRGPTDEITYHLNKRGCQLIAHHEDLQVEGEAITRGSETDFEYAEYRAWIEDNGKRTNVAIGVCSIDEDGTEKWDIDMKAETRAKKRAVKWATGGGASMLMEDGDR